jgi:hypothetical protein
LADALPLKNAKDLLKGYYAGYRLDSPNGGFLIPLAVTSRSDGQAVALFECSASSLRYKLIVPKATSTERRKVREVMKTGVDPDCPRHGAGQRLVRVGKDLVCGLCGVSFAKA